MTLGKGVTGFKPALQHSSFHGLLPADRWWTQVVWVIPDLPRLTRRAIVLTAANKDGGAHVDEELPAEYQALARAGGVRIHLQGPDSSLALGDVQSICLRDMAYELLSSSELLELTA